MPIPDEAHRKAVQSNRVAAMVGGAASLATVIVAIVAASRFGGTDFGAPFYAGGFIIAPLELFHVGITIYVLLQLQDTNIDDAAKSGIECAIKSQFALTLCIFITCFVGIMLAGLSGFYNIYSDDINNQEVSTTHKTLAICIIVGCVAIGAVHVLFLFSMCGYSVYFGLPLGTQGANAMAEINRRNTLAQNMLPMNGNGHQLLQLQQRILQQQLLAQEQQQQQQRQQQPPPQVLQGYTSFNDTPGGASAFSASSQLPSVY